MKAYGHVERHNSWHHAVVYRSKNSYHGAWFDGPHRSTAPGPEWSTWLHCCGSPLVHLAILGLLSFGFRIAIPTIPAHTLISWASNVPQSLDGRKSGSVHSDIEHYIPILMQHFMTLAM